MVIANRQPLTSSLASRVASAAFWMQISRVLQMIMSFGFSVLVARGLKVTDFSAYATLQGVIGITLLVSTLGTGKALSRVVPELALAKSGAALIRQVGGLYTAMLLLRTSLGLFQGIAALIISHYLPAGNPLRVFAQFGGIVLLIILLQSAAETTNDLAIAQLRMRPVFVWGLLSQLGGLVTSAALFRLAGPALIYVVDALLVSALIFAAGQVAAFRAYVVTCRFRSAVVSRSFVSFSATAWTIDLITYGLNNQIDVIILSVLLTGSPEVGYYAIGSTLASRLHSLIFGPFFSTALPVFSEARAAGGWLSVRRAWHSYYRITSLVAIPLFVLLIVQAPAVLTLLYSTRYAGAVPALRGYAAFSLVLVLLGQGLGTQALYAMDRVRQSLAIRIFFGPANVALDWLLIGHLGALGAVMATGICQGLTSLAELVVCYRSLPGLVPLSFAARVLTGSLLAVLAASTVTGRLGGGALMAAMLVVPMYLGACWLLKPLDAEDLQILVRARSPLVHRLARALGRLSRSPGTRLP